MAVHNASYATGRRPCLKPPGPSFYSLLAALAHGGVRKPQAPRGRCRGGAGCRPHAPMHFFGGSCVWLASGLLHTPTSTRREPRGGLAGPKGEVRCRYKQAAGPTPQKPRPALARADDNAPFQLPTQPCPPFISDMAMVPHTGLRLYLEY